MKLKSAPAHMRCILCNGKDARYFHTSPLYDYLKCTCCDLIFADPGQRLTPQEEKNRYDFHENDPFDPRYRNFLNQLFEPLIKLLPPAGSGLDFGSGPGPALSQMFREAGYPMNVYDPFYANDPSVLNLKYDFITSTETVEHFYNPGKEFEQLWGCLKPGGYLGIMTLLAPPVEKFPDWHYIRDDTHVCFYSEKTFLWLARKWGAELTITGPRSIILRKEP